MLKYLRIIIDPTEVSNCFNIYFNEIGRGVVRNLPNYSATCVKKFLINRVTFTILLEPVSINKIFNIVNELNINKAAGYNVLFLSNFRPPCLPLYFQHW